MAESYSERIQRKHFSTPQMEKPPVDPNLSWLQQINAGLKPLEEGIRAGLAGASRTFGPAIPYAAAKADELASKAVGALMEKTGPGGRGDRPITPAWQPKTYEDVYKEGRARRDAYPEAAKAGDVLGGLGRDYYALRIAGKGAGPGSLVRANTPAGQILQSGLTSPIGATIKEMNKHEDEAYDKGIPWNPTEGLTNIARDTVASMTGGFLGGVTGRRFLPGGGILKHGELLPKEKDPIRAKHKENEGLPVNPNLHFGELASQAGQTEVAAKAHRAMREAKGIELPTQPSWVRSPQEWAELQQRYGSPPVIPPAMVDRLKERAQPGGFNETVRGIDDRMTLAQDRIQRGAGGTPGIPAQPGPPPIPAVPGVPPLNLQLTGVTPPGINPLRDRQHQLARMEGRNADPPIPGNMIPGHSMDIWDRTMKGLPLSQQLEIERLLAAVAPTRARNNINLSSAITERSGVKQDAAQYQSARDAIKDAFPMAAPTPSSINVTAPVLAAATGKAPLAHIGFSRDTSKSAAKATKGMVDEPLTFMDQIGVAGPRQTFGNALGQTVGREGISPLIETYIGFEDERRKREKVSR
jgi:hypothetical protein